MYAVYRIIIDQTLYSANLGMTLHVHFHYCLVVWRLPSVRVPNMIYGLYDHEMVTMFFVYCHRVHVEERYVFCPIFTVIVSQCAAIYSERVKESQSTPHCKCNIPHTVCTGNENCDNAVDTEQ